MGAQDKFAEIRRVRPPMKAGITAEELTQLYWIDEVRNAAQDAGLELYHKKEGVRTKLSKAVLATRLARHFNGGADPPPRPMPQAPEPPKKSPKKKAAPKKAPAKKAVPKRAAKKASPKAKAKKAAKPAAKKVAAKKAAPKKAPAKRAKAQPKRAAAPAPSPRAAAAPAAPSPRANANAAKTEATTWTHEAKWQYFDAAKPRGPWFDYDPNASDMVEMAYLDWKKNPFVDVRSVKSGQWEYMVDFNEMQQQNVQHSAHTKRKIGRVWVKDGSDALKEQREIKERVRLQRQTSQSSQARTLSRTVSQDTLKRTPSTVGPPRGWRAPKSKDDFKAGAKVKTLAKPNTDYSGYPMGALDKEATVATAPMGFPPIQCKFAEGTVPASFWFCWEDLLVAE